MIGGAWRILLAQTWPLCCVSSLPLSEPKPRFAPVAQVAHLRLLSKDVSGCSTTPYDFSFLVRNEEAGGSNPLSSTIFQKRHRACQKSYRGTLGLSSLSDSFRYLVIHPERHCLCAASSVNTSRLTGLIPQSKPDSFRLSRQLGSYLAAFTVTPS